MNKIQIEKAAIESEYNSQIDDKLQQLHTLRHDMKNHLLIIARYVSACLIARLIYPLSSFEAAVIALSNMFPSTS